MSRALIVNPDPTSRLAASLLLESLGFEVLTAGMGAEALGHLFRGGVDLVLLDGRAEEGDPFALIGTMASFSARNRACILFTTPAGSAATVNEALEAGADDYLIGAFGRDVLAFKLAQAASRGLLRSDPSVIYHLRKTG